MDKKRILIIGTGIAVMGGAGYLLYKWQQNLAASNAANADAANQSDAQLAQMMMESPLSYASNSGTSASVSGPSIDTGNAALQALIASLINPTSTTPPSTTPPSGLDTGTQTTSVKDVPKANPIARTDGNARGFLNIINDPNTVPYGTGNTAVMNIDQLNAAQQNIQKYGSN